MARPLALTLALALLLLAGCGSRQDQRITITGTHHVGSGDLRSAARRELNAFAQQPSEATLADAGYSMEQELHRQGFAQARVAVHLTGGAGTPAHGSITIKEGPRCYLGHLSFPGASHVGHDQLAGTLHAEGIGLFDWAKAPFREDDCERAAESVESLYLLDGYYRVEVARPKVQFRPGTAIADVAIAVQEGRRYTVQRVDFGLELSGSGMHSGDLDGVLAGLDVLGHPYYARLPSVAEATIRSWLFDHGHLEAVVQHQVGIMDASGAVEVRYLIRPGPLLLLAGIRISGNHRTTAGFIRHTLDSQVGQPISGGHVDEGMSHLARSGAFTSERWHAESLSGNGDRRPAAIQVDVEEARARTVDFEAGYGTYEELRGGIRYRDRNFLGIGRSFEVHPNASMKGHGIDSRIRDNYLLGRENTLELSASYLIFREPSYELSLLQATLSLEHRFGSRWSTRSGYTYESERATDISAPIIGVDGTSYIPAPRVFGEVRFDSRDSPVGPSRGTLATVGMAYSTRDLGSRLDFIEYSASAAQFIPIGKDLVLGINGRYTTRELLNSAETLPIQERLFLGGENSVRSFREFMISPRDQQGDLEGGLTAAMATIELRYRLVDNLWVAGFYDIGEVDLFTWQLDGTTGQGIGTGMRYQLPVGPMRLDVAYNPARSPLTYRGWMGQAAVGFSF